MQIAAEIEIPSHRYLPPGKLTEAKNSNESRREFVFTFHRFCCTSVIRPTTTSPISPTYRFFSGRIDINLLTFSITPATDAFIFSSLTYVP